MTSEVWFPSLMALLGVIVGIVASEAFGWLRERDRRVYEEDREYRLFQRQTLLEIHQRMWTLRSTSAQLQHEYQTGQHAAEQQNESAMREAKQRFDETRDRCIDTSHRLETLIGLVEDSGVATEAEKLREIGVKLCTEYDDEELSEDLNRQFREIYGDFRALILPAIKRL